jgi:polyhydroxyalkanoate synthesis regulator phasin
MCLDLYEKVSSAWKKVQEKLGEHLVTTGQMTEEEARAQYMDKIQYVP